MMRRYLTMAMLALALCATAPSAQRTQPPAPTGPQPLIEIPQMKHDFGDVFERGRYEFTFTVRNLGKADLLIEDVKPG